VNSQFRDDVINVLNHPIGPSALEILRFFRSSEELVMDGEEEF
jgi:hypothetical protein